MAASARGVGAVDPADSLELHNEELRHPKAFFDMQRRSSRSAGLLCRYSPPSVILHRRSSRSQNARAPTSEASAPAATMSGLAGASRNRAGD